jgi:hypothetical protein
MAIPWDPDGRAFRSRKNLAGEMRRCLDLQFSRALQGLKQIANPDAYKDSKLITLLDGYRGGNAPMWRDAYDALGKWQAALDGDDDNLTEHWKKTDTALGALAQEFEKDKDLEKYKDKDGVEYHEAPFLGPLINAIRRELLRQVEEHIVSPDGKIAGGDPLTPLTEQLKALTTRHREHIDQAIAEIWKEESHALSEDITRQAKDIPLRFRVAGEQQKLIGVGITFSELAEQVKIWESRLKDHITDYENNSTGDKLDPQGFNAFCRTLGAQLQKARTEVASAKLPPRERMNADHYLRLTTESLMALLDAMPPADWYDDPDRVRKTRHDYLAVAASRGESQQTVPDKPELLADLWNQTKKDLLESKKGPLPSEWKRLLTKSFDKYDLSETLTKFAKETRFQESQDLAWQISQALGDYTGVLFSIETKIDDWPNEAHLVRMLEALTATGEAVSRMLVQRRGT